MNELLRRYLFLPEQASTVARGIDELHYSLILSTLGGATLVTLVGAYFLVRYRRRLPDGEPSNPDARAKPHPLFKLSALVTLTAIFIVWWVIGLKQYMRLRVAPEGAMTVYVTAKKWMWKFGYPEGARSIATLVVPVGRPVKLVLTSRDVIHSLFVPAFRIKQDALPGRYTTAWFQVVAPGTYPILCTQYCGTGHSTMRGEVVALPPEDYARWLAGSTPLPRPAGPRYEEPALGLAGAADPREELGMPRQGERVAAEEGCLRCHTLDGTPHIGPTWAGLYGAMVPLEGGGEVVADEAYITESIMDPKVKIHRGYTPVMPSYLGRLHAPDTAAIVELIKSLKDVTPRARAPLPAEPLPPSPGPSLGEDAEGRGVRRLPAKPEPPGGEIPEQEKGTRR